MAKSLPNWIHLTATAFALFATIESRSLAENEAHSWARSTHFAETSFTETIDGKIRIHVNAPVDDSEKPGRATRLVVYTLPAGNTIEHTLGCQAKPGSIGITTAST